jgi:alpha-tubulin suppressor-like RCC1 family protein
VAPKIVGTFAATSIDVGDDFSCAIAGSTDASGGYTCWGANVSGQLGSGTMTTTNTPTPPTSGYTVVATGASFACAQSLSALGCWGDNTFGQLDLPTSTKNSSTLNATGIQASIFALGSNHGCAANGANLTCWGDNDDHQASASDASIVTGTSTQGFGQVIAETTAGAHHTCITTKTALDAGNVLCTGDNSHGQLGNAGTPATTLGPAAVNGYMNVIAAGYSHTCASSTLQNRVYCWGDNTAGQLGDGTMTQRNTPVVVEW